VCALSNRAANVEASAPIVAYPSDFLLEGAILAQRLEKRIVREIVDIFQVKVGLVFSLDLLAWITWVDSLEDAQFPARTESRRKTKTKLHNGETKRNSRLLSSNLKSLRLI
jgi:hypothetical protein